MLADKALKINKSRIPDFWLIGYLVCVLHLCEFLVFEWDFSIVADLPQGGTKAPLVSCDAQGRWALHTLRSDPRDTVHTLCKGQPSQLQ